MKRLNNKLTFIVLFLVVVALLATRFSYAYQFSLTSDEYEIINNTIIVTPITNAVTQSDIKNNINYLGNIEIYDLKDKIINDNDYVGTGFKLKTASNYYDIIVLGDVTGDGKISIGDVAKLYNHFRSGNILNNESLEAGKVNRNSDISIGDVAKLYNFYRGNTSLVYYNKTLKLTNYDNLDISLDNPIPGDSITRTFSVKNSGTSTEEYNIFLSEIINSFNDKTDLVYTLDSDNGCASSERVVPSISGDESKIISSCNIPKNTTHTYTLKLSFKKDVLPQDDNANVSFSAKISLNDFEKANIDTNAYLAETVEDLKTKNIEVGKHVITKGYYSPLDGGNAYYVIEAKDKQKIDNGRYIELDNGNIAKLIPENNTINVKQYGLVGDGIVEEAAELQSVMKQLKEDDCNTIYIT